MIIFFRSIFDDLGIPQQQATIMYEDNRGALFMANAQQTSQRTRHIDIKYFALIDWVQEDLMILESIPTSDNCADAMTKALAKTLFYHHTDTIMGRRIPEQIQLLICEAKIKEDTIQTNTAEETNTQTVVYQMLRCNPAWIIRGRGGGNRGTGSRLNVVLCFSLLYASAM